VVLTLRSAIGKLIPLALHPNPQIAPFELVSIGGIISSAVLFRIVVLVK
jgi:hypothetical protein